MPARPRFLLLPLDLDCWEIVPTRVRRLSVVESVRLILSTVIERSMYGPDGWASLPPQEGARLAGGWTAWGVIRSTLVENHVFEHDGNTGYRLAPKWERSPLAKHVPRDRSVLERLNPDAGIPRDRQCRPYSPRPRRTAGRGIRAVA